MVLTFLDQYTIVSIEFYIHKVIAYHSSQVLIKCYMFTLEILLTLIVCFILWLTNKCCLP